jgi:hypothetical protein
MKNLFVSSVSPSSNDLLKAGNYTLELVSIRPGKGRVYEGKAPKDTITFSFCEVSSRAPVNRTVSASKDPRGKCIEFVRQLAGSRQPSPNELESGQALSDFIERLIGRKFNATIAPSDNGKFNNIQSIYPLEDR